MLACTYCDAVKDAHYCMFHVRTFRQSMFLNFKLRKKALVFKIGNKRLVSVHSHIYICPQWNPIVTLEYLQPLSISSSVVLNRSIFAHVKLVHSLLLAKMIISVNQNKTLQNTVSKPQVWSYLISIHSFLPSFQAPKIMLKWKLLGSNGGNNVDKLLLLPWMICEINHPIDLSKEGMIYSHSDIFTGVPLLSSLPSNYSPSIDLCISMSFDSKTTSSGITAIIGGSSCFLGGGSDLCENVWWRLLPGDEGRKSWWLYSERIEY